VKVTFWGTRGSQASPGADTVRYGGNTSCVEVRNDAGQLVVLDAGTGIRRLGASIGAEVPRVDVLLTHLHLDHIQGLGFFDCLYRPGFDVHLWGPASTTLHLWSRLSRYLSPPLFPVRLRDLPCSLSLHDVPLGEFEIPGFQVRAALVCHPAPTVGYRLEADGVSITYISDHEPALGAKELFGPPEWTSGFDLAEGTDLLVHDSQYTDAEYTSRVGWGHSTVGHAVAFARAVHARRFVPFHYDPTHDDAMLDRMHEAARSALPPECELIPAREGATIEVAPSPDMVAPATKFDPSSSGA
jgi:phosphoribosyl 1,2-cyclic phosphodiesterase